MKLSNLAQRFASLLSLGQKASATQPLICNMFAQQTRGVYPQRNLTQYSDDAYRKNVVAFMAIHKVAQAVATIPLEVKIGDRDADPSHPLVQLLKRPNPWTSKQQLFESYAAYLLLTGNTYLEGVGPDNGAPLELWSLRPDRTRVVPGQLGVAGYVYEVNGQIKKWDCDPVTGQSPILHVKTFNPLNDWYGMSPVEAAAFAIDGHNEAGEWNQSLLQNSARPSGALVYANAAGGVLGDKQFERLKEEINSTMAGTKNAGRVPILEGGLSWQQMSMSPAEMDWINGKNVSAREIALAFGVPPQILSIPGDNTYSNYQEARASLYEDTVLPLTGCLIDSLNVWLAPSFGENVCIELDIDDLPAFAEQRKARWAAVGSANWLTTNEKREATGYEEVDTPEAHEILIPSGLVPLSISTEPVDGNETGDLAGGDIEDTNTGLENVDEPDTEGEDGEDGNAAGAGPRKPTPPAVGGSSTVAGVNPAAAGESVQVTALNGAQIASLLEIIGQVTSGDITTDIADVLLRISFPAVPPATLSELVAAMSAAPSKPKPEQPDFTPGAPNVPPVPPKKPAPAKT